MNSRKTPTGDLDSPLAEAAGPTAEVSEIQRIANPLQYPCNIIEVGVPCGSEFQKEVVMSMSRAIIDNVS